MLLLTDVSLGVDSLVVSVAVSPLISTRSSRVLLATLFGAFDALATVLGASFGWHLPDALPDDTAQYLQVGAVVSYGVYIYLVARWGRGTIARWPVWVLPVLCSVDNFTYGIASDPTAGTIAGQAVILGIVSAALSGLGLTVGQVLAARKGAPQPRVVAVILLIAGAVLAAT